MSLGVTPHELIEGGRKNNRTQKPRPAPLALNDFTAAMSNPNPAKSSNPALKPKPSSANRRTEQSISRNDAAAHSTAPARRGIGVSLLALICHAYPMG